MESLDKIKINSHFDEIAPAKETYFYPGIGTFGGNYVVLKPKSSIHNCITNLNIIQ